MKRTDHFFLRFYDGQVSLFCFAIVSTVLPFLLASRNVVAAALKLLPAGGAFFICENIQR